MLFMHIERHLIDAPGIDALDDVARFDIAEQGYFAAQLRRKRMLCAANDHVGLDTTLLEGLYGVLRRLRLEFPRCTQVWYQGQMDGHAILLREFPLELPDGFDEWLGFHIAHGTADLSENHVILARTAQQQHPPLDFVSDVRDDLHGLAQIRPFPLLRNHRMVNLACGYIVGFGRIDAEKALIVP